MLLVVASHEKCLHALHTKCSVSATLAVRRAVRATPHVGASVEPPWEMGGAVSGRVRAGQRPGQGACLRVRKSRPFSTPKCLQTSKQGWS